MKLLLWVGNESNQKALANKLANEFEVVGIVTETRNQQRKWTVKKVIDAIYRKLFLSEINHAWWGMKDYFDQQYPNYPNVPILDVANINSEEAYNFSKQFTADLIIVSGTRMVKQKMLSVQANKGILNLHTGLSPYIKGGPNCTNWCIATQQYHMVGNTIMWIDEGIDSGNIVCTEFTEVDWSTSLLEVHKTVMCHAHELYLKAVRFLANGGVSNVPQSEIGEGKTFYTREWQLPQQKALLRHFKNASKVVNSDYLSKQRKGIRVVKI